MTRRELEKQLGIVRCVFTLIGRTKASDHPCPELSIHLRSEYCGNQHLRDEEAAQLNWDRDVR